MVAVSAAVVVVAVEWKASESKVTDEHVKFNTWIRRQDKDKYITIRYTFVWGVMEVTNGVHLFYELFTYPALPT